MVALLLAALAWAAPVECDALEAARLLAEAQIEERRAPVTHPELIPGLALASARTGTDLRTALTDLCEEQAKLSLAPSEQWEAADWSAHTFLMTRSETVGCTLFQQTIAISVGVAEDTAPRYSLRSRLPVYRTPVGDCPTQPSWREEEVLAGADGQVRVVLGQDLVAGELTHSEVLVRRASPSGWTEQVLLEPAPDRLLDGGGGPTVDLARGEGDPWVVAHGDRTGAPPECSPRPGQTVWTWSEERGAWTSADGREALALLAERGLWRLAGHDGWMLILHQEDEEDAEEVGWRRDKLQRTSPEPLHVYTSARFPGLNPGFLVIAPAPFPDKAQAERARNRARRWRRTYVKRAWEAPDPCEIEGSPPDQGSTQKHQ